MNTGLTPTSSEVERSVPPTLIAVILDESGSMETKRDDVVSGYNRFLDEQRALPDSCRMSLTKFNTRCALLFPPTSLSRVAPLDRRTYTPAGNTALFDAIAEAVRVAENHKQPDERVLCLIVTDGQENSSRETTREQVTELIKAHEERGDWTFVYLGVAPDQFVKDMNLAGTQIATNTAVYNSAAPSQSWNETSYSTISYRASREKSGRDFYTPKRPAE